MTACTRAPLHLRAPCQHSEVQNECVIDLCEVGCGESCCLAGSVGYVCKFDPVCDRELAGETGGAAEQDESKQINSKVNLKSKFLFSFSTTMLNLCKKKLLV